MICNIVAKGIGSGMLLNFHIELPDNYREIQKTITLEEIIFLIKQEAEFGYPMCPDMANKVTDHNIYFIYNGRILNYQDEYLFYDFIADGFHFALKDNPRLSANRLDQINRESGYYEYIAGRDDGAIGVGHCDGDRYLDDDTDFTSDRAATTSTFPSSNGAPVAAVPFNENTTALFAAPSRVQVDVSTVNDAPASTSESADSHREMDPDSSKKCVIL